MSKRHGAREQKRLAKRNAKRDTRRQQLARRNSPDPTVRLKDAERWPVTACLVPENLWQLGIGNLVIARNMPGGGLACGIFLVDVFCLGVKDAAWRILSPGEFKELRSDIGAKEQLQDVPPEYFAKLIYRAAEYAQALGFAPHHDFRHVVRLLAGVDPSLCPDEFEFGWEGRPHYIRGPSESLDKARAIAHQVDDLGGYYTIPLRGDVEGFEFDEDCDAEFDELDFVMDDDEEGEPFNPFLLG
jgi:hypothetical protein